MAQVQTTFTGNSQQLLQQYNKLYQANVRLQQQMAGMSHQSKKQHDQFKGFIDEQVRGLKHMVLGYAGVEAAIGFLEHSYEAWADRIDEVGEKVERVNKGLARQLVLAGEASKSGQVESILFNTPGVTREQAMQAYSGVSQGAPGMANKAALASEVAKAAGTGLDLEQFGEFAGQVGTFASGKSPQQVRDLALTIQSQLGKYLQQFESSRSFGAVRGLAESGAMSQTEALAFAVQAARKNVPQLPQALLSSIEKEYERPHIKPGMTREEYRAQMVLSQAGTPADRARLIMSDPEAQKFALAGKAKGHMDRMMTPEALAERRALQAAQEGSSGELGRVETGLAGSYAGRSVQHEQEMAASTEAAEHAAGMDYNAVELKLARDLLKKRLTSTNWLTSGQVTARFEFNRVMNNLGMGAWVAAIRPGEGSIPGALGSVDPESRSMFISAANKTAGFERYAPDGGPGSGKALPLLDKIHAEIKRGNDERRSVRLPGGHVVHNLNEP